MLRRCLPPSWHSDANLLRIYDCELVTRDTRRNCTRLSCRGRLLGRVLAGGDVAGTCVLPLAAQGSLPLFVLLFVWGACAYGLTTVAQLVWSARHCRSTGSRRGWQVMASSDGVRHPSWECRRASVVIGPPASERDERYFRAPNDVDVSVVEVRQGNVLQQDSGRRIHRDQRIAAHLGCRCERGVCIGKAQADHA